MSEMNQARNRLQQMPPWARVWLSSLLLLGVLSMHTAIAGDEGGLLPHHASTSVAQSIDVPDIIPPLDGESSLSTADCGSLAMLCLAMVAAASAYIVLRDRAANRVVWRLSPTLGRNGGRSRRPFEALSPRERSSVLRR